MYIIITIYIFNRFVITNNAHEPPKPLRVKHLTHFCFYSSPRSVLSRLRKTLAFKNEY